MSIIERILQAAESCLNWSMEETPRPEQAYESAITEWEHTVRQGHEQMATYAAGIHCLSEQLQQLERAESISDSSRHVKQIAEKRKELAESKQVYNQLKGTLKQLEERLATARQKQEELSIRSLLKGRNEDG